MQKKEWEKSLLCAAKYNLLKPFEKAQMLQITIFEKFSYLYKHRAFQSWPYICRISFLKEVRAFFLKNTNYHF